MAKITIDLQTMTPAELRKLIQEAEDCIPAAKQRAQDHAKKIVEEALAKEGLTLEDFTPTPSETATASRGKAKTPPKPRNIKYRHPEIPELTHHDGQGARPKWLKEYITVDGKVDKDLEAKCEIANQ